MTPKLQIVPASAHVEPAIIPKPTRAEVIAALLKVAKVEYEAEGAEFRMALVEFIEGSPNLVRREMENERVNALAESPEIAALWKRMKGTK